jgi:hypothetical protein
VQEQDTPEQTYCIRVKDFTVLAELKGNEYHKYLKESCYEIMSKPITFSKKGKKDFKMMNWVSYCEYIDNEAIIKFKISQDIKPYILDLKSNYLKYDIKNILVLKSEYSIRVYEWLKDELEKKARYGKNAEFTLTIEEIRERLEIPNSYRFDNIKQRILDKAQEDLEKDTDLRFEWQVASKIGRAVSHIKFKIYPNFENIKELKQTLPSYLNTFISFVNELRKLYMGSFKFFFCANFEINEIKKQWYFGINNDNLLYAVPADEQGDTITLSQAKAEIIYNAVYLCSLHSDIFRKQIEVVEDFRELQQNKDFWGVLNSEIVLTLKENDPRVKPMF